MTRHLPTTPTDRPDTTRRSWARVAGIARLAAAGLITATLLSIGAHQAAATSDPGVALYTYLHDHGATMPASWAQTVDAQHASACAEYAKDYADYAPGAVDEWGVTATLAHAAVAATGFCS